jgi:ligand-binding sensor domain-containing protein/serine phosphatase RsbU (regulator of sigma subunit)
MKIKFWPCSVKVIRHISLMILFFVLPVNLLHAQTYFFENYGVEQGLSSSKVYSVIQDRSDQIWIGTETGVSRFDGSRFENFSSAEGMAGGGVVSLTEDSLGRIWFGHQNGGMSLFDGHRFSRIKFDSITIDEDITGIKQFEGHLWITTSKNGAIRTDIPQPGDTVLKGKQYRGSEGLSGQVTSYCIDSKNNLYFIADVGIKRYNKEKDVFETFRPDSLTSFFSTTVMFEDSKGNYWFGTVNGGLYKYVKSTGQMKIYDIRDGLAHQWTSFITEDYKGNVWVGSWGGGITVFSGDKMLVFKKSNGLDATTIHCILEDKEKNMIIADHYTGISIYKGDHFVTYSDETFLPDKNVFSVEEDELGRYWFGTNAGISVFNPAGEGDSRIQFYTDEKYSIGNKIRFLKSDNKGNIWIGTDGMGLSRYDIKTKKFIYDTRISEYLHSNNIITALEIDKKNRVWIGNMDRLVIWDPEKEEAQFFTQGNGLIGSWISALYCDREGDLWIGSEGNPKMGITKYINETGKFQIIDIGEGFVPRTISQTPDKTIWVGTTSGLLAIRDDKVAFHLNEQSGLLSNNVKLLQPQGNNFLYIGTNYGLNRLNLTDSTLATFTKRNGFSGIETQPNASVADSKGNLWFGTANGVTRLTPSLMPTFSKPKVHFSDMEINYAQRDMKPDLKLNFKENTIAFNFYSVCLADPGAVKYKVMLKGFDTNWKPAGIQTIKDYSLSPGHYTFRVLASDSYGYWSEEPLEYSFVIKPPFYQTPWFIGICLIIAAIGVMSYIKIREKNLIREKKILEQKVEERTAEVVQKSVEIEEKNRDITASIRYAERIQRAMLPREDTFLETFVLYMPKDIVSGDFYWMYDNGELQFIAACDCTGHGVPGAFMSIIGHNSLNKVVREYGITHPGPILDQLNAEVTKALVHRDEETIKDGMDMALIAFDRKKFTLEYAGAYNPVYVVRKGEIFTYKGDRFPIGMSSQHSKKTFVNQKVDIKPGDMVYMSSDGYADQFGSRDAKKYKSGNVKKLLCQIWDFPVNDQRDRLEKEILNWKGDLPQIDDIMFVGTRIPEP